MSTTVDLRTLSFILAIQQRETPLITALGSRAFESLMPQVFSGLALRAGVAFLPLDTMFRTFDQLVPCFLSSRPFNALCNVGRIGASQCHSLSICSVLRALLSQLGPTDQYAGFGLRSITSVLPWTQNLPSFERSTARLQR